MNVYRITKNKHLEEDLLGIGASLFPGRWNKKDIRCLYTAESRALALVEHMANVTRENYVRAAFTLRTLFVPDALIVHVPLDSIPKNWREKPPPEETRTFGAELLRSKKGLAYILPSSIIPQEFNVIIDPTHPDIPQVAVVEDELFEFDSRLKE